MTIRNGRRVMLLVLLTALMLPPATLAQSNTAPSGSWSAVTAVAPGTKLGVKLRDGKKLDGKLISASDNGLSVSVKDKPVEVRREDVLSVHLMSKKSVTKAVLIGMGAGAAAGAVIGLAGSAGNDSFDSIDHAVTAGLTVVGAGAGALAGYLVGRSGRKRVLIYQAGQP
jgi:hypothetical protein